MLTFNWNNECLERFTDFFAQIVEGLIMNKKQNCLYIFVSALTIGTSGYLYATDVLADADSPITQVANTNSQTDNLADGGKVALDTPSVQANSIQQTQQLSAEAGSGQIEDVKYSIDNDTLTLNGGTLTSAHDYPWMGNTDITKVQITAPLFLENSAPVGFLSEMTNLESITGMDNIDTSKATNMSSMFKGDVYLTDLDISKFNTSNVTDMSWMFDDNQNLRALDVSKFNTSKVTNMAGMFSATESLTDLNVSNFDTSKVKDMSYMFFQNMTLKSLDVSNFNTSQVTNMSNMFGRNRLTVLNLANFDTSKVTDMDGMFTHSQVLTSLALPNFDTSKVTTMANMFAWDDVLTSLDLSSFDTSNVTDISRMFYDNDKLSILKLGNKTLNKGLDGSELPEHSSASKIPNSSPVRYATGPGWLAVDANNGGTVDNPQGKTVYDGYLANRPAEMETYVWQQDSKPVAKQTVTVAYIDAATGKPIPGVEAKAITGFQGREYDVTGTDSRPAISGYTWDGKTPTNAKGTYGDKAIVVQYVYRKNSTSSMPNTPSTTTAPSSQTTSSQASSGLSSSNASTNSSTASSTNNSATNVPGYAATKGTVVYSIKRVGLYKTTDFTKNNRRSWYAKKPRINRPMFVVTGYKRAANGALRYQVRDVNHTSRTDGQKGYITASQKYVRPVYYATKHSTITVINPRGVNAYRQANLTGKVKNYRQGTVLRIKGMVKHNLTTRYILTNGDYITANRKLVNMGRHKQVKSVKTKLAINRYSNVNLTKKNQSIAKNRTLKVYGYDYSRRSNVTKHGTLRYRVAGGYITANTKYIQVIDRG
ncbi:BspA family leucine-rich repeat surface protein [Lentilactobacillus hilgardii]|uniref:BspA family leucine-rich repeat surface protein n=1 Tax=Lentilactobacillus hilgardii TaxID=1588 RepID=UPI0021A66158|nr:BspA family leucine-rich repeat surface protein [Lentilactobacillus hilgardii]